MGVMGALDLSRGGLGKVHHLGYEPGRTLSVGVQPAQLAVRRHSPETAVTSCFTLPSEGPGATRLTRLRHPQAGPGRGLAPWRAAGGRSPPGPTWVSVCLWEAGHFLLTRLKLLFFFSVFPLCSTPITALSQGFQGPFTVTPPKRKLSLERHWLLVSSFLELDNLETPKVGDQHLTDAAGSDQPGGCLTMRTVQNRNAS